MTSHPATWQVLVPEGTWQRTVWSAADALVSCTVSPGLDVDVDDVEPDRG